MWLIKFLKAGVVKDGADGSDQGAPQGGVSVQYLQTYIHYILEWFEKVVKP